MAARAPRFRTRIRLHRRAHPSSPSWRRPSSGPYSLGCSANALLTQMAWAARTHAVVRQAIRRLLPRSASGTHISRLARIIPGSRLRTGTIWPILGILQNARGAICGRAYIAACRSSPCGCDRLGRGRPDLRPARSESDHGKNFGAVSARPGRPHRACRCRSMAADASTERRASATAFPHDAPRPGPLMQRGTMDLPRLQGAAWLQQASAFARALGEAP
jgi:hypothetical protein